MGNGTNPSKEIVEGIQPVLDRVGEFFHLFDLSFFVAGTMTMGAMAFFFEKSGQSLAFPFPGWVKVIAFFVVTYSAGLMSFSLGRLINGALFRKGIFPKQFKASLMDHQFMGPDEGSYLVDDRRLWGLYVRMWQDLAFTGPKSYPFKHLSRYWVMAATYDGLGFSFLVWAMVSFLTACGTIVPKAVAIKWGVGGGMIFLALAVGALMQGANYYKYQIEDLVASAASAKALAT